MRREEADNTGSGFFQPAAVRLFFCLAVMGRERNETEKVKLSFHGLKYGIFVSKDGVWKNESF